MNRICKKHRQLNKSAPEGEKKSLRIPKVKESGKFIYLADIENESDVSQDDLENAQLVSYMILPRYGMTL